MSWEEDERRVAEILGVQAGQRLPAVSRKALRQYHTYLTANLSLPCTAKDKDGQLTMTSLFSLNECPDLIFWGDYAYPVQATVLVLTEKRVKIEADGDGKIVIRYVPPQSLQRQGGACEDTTCT